MATKVFMEALSPTMEEGRLVKWNKNEGDAVKSGDVLAEVETDKAIMDLVARGDGILRKRLIAEGEARAEGTLVGVIGAADEDNASVAGSAGHATAPAQGRSPAPAPQPGGDEKPPDAAPRQPAAAPAQATQAAPASPQTAAAQGGMVRSSPLARRMAREKGVELS